MNPSAIAALLVMSEMADAIAEGDDALAIKLIVGARDVLAVEVEAGTAPEQATAAIESLDAVLEALGYEVVEDEDEPAEDPAPADPPDADPPAEPMKAAGRMVTRRTDGSMLFCRQAVEVAHGKFAIASTSDEDSYGDIVDVKTMKLDRFVGDTANPVMLFQHNHECPIGQWDDVKLDKVAGKDAIVGTPKFDVENEHDPLAKKIAHKWETKQLRAVSIGFMPDWHTSRSRGALPKEHWAYKPDCWGTFYEGASLLEMSIVSVPANPFALGKADKATRIVKREPPPAPKPATPDWWATAD